MVGMQVRACIRTVVNSRVYSGQPFPKFANSCVGGCDCRIFRTGSVVCPSAQLYAKKVGQKRDSALGLFNGIFVTVFAFCQVTGRLASTFILNGGFEFPDNPVASDRAVFLMNLTYSLVACVSVVGVFFLKKLPAQEHTDAGAKSEISIRKRLLSTIQLAMTPKMGLMIPSNLAFGIVSGFIGAGLAPLINRSLGASYVGVLLSIGTAVQTIVGLPLGKLSDLYGQKPVMILGAVGDMALGGYLLISGISDTATLLQIAIMASLFGLGHGVWQSMNSAVFGKFFRTELEPAFGNLKLWSGLSTAVAFFLFPSLS
eukprot:442528_1